jgi:aminoglycoside phosphotransferase (APT) family kinase protein
MASGQGNELDAPRAAEVIRAQFPAVRAEEVGWLGEGYDSTAFEVDREWVFRFPKRGDVERQLLVELMVLPILAAQSPLPVPEFRFSGVPSQLFPRHFGGYRKIPGVPAIRIDPGAVPFDRLAPVLAAFLSWLHSFPRTQAARLGVPQHPVASTIEEARAEALADFEHVARVAGDRPLRDWLEFLTDAPGARIGSDVRTSLLHGDFAAEHVLYDVASGSITGVIDWSEVAIGDPSLDLAGLFHWGGDALLDAVLSTYRGPVDRDTLHRARYLAACRGVGDVVFGLETARQEYVDAGIRALTLSVPPSRRAV